MSMFASHMPSGSSTTAHGGKRLHVEWNDDGKAPTHRDWGRVNIFLATGSRDVQFKLQTLATNVSYNQNSGDYTLNANAGPNGGYYFLRFEGTNTTTNPIPAMSFSARFSLDDMSGNFNSTIMSTLQGASGTAQLTAAAAAAATPSASSVPSFGFTTSSISSMSSAAAPSASVASSQSNAVKSTSAAASNKLAGYASAIVGLAAVGAAFF